MLSNIHHRTLSLLILCTVLLAPSLLLGGCSPIEDTKAPHKDKVLDEYSHAIYWFQWGIRTPLLKEAVDPYEGGKAPLTLEEVMTGLKYSADYSSSYISLELHKFKQKLEKLRADPNIAGVYPDVDKAADDLLSTIDEFDVNAWVWIVYYANYDAIKQKHGAKKLDTDFKFVEGELKRTYEDFSNASYQFLKIIYSHRMELRDYYLNGDTSRKSGPFSDLEHQIDALHYMQDELPLDQTVVEKKIDEINKTMEKLPKDEDFEDLEDYRIAINRYTRAFRSYTTGKITQEELARAYRALLETSMIRYRPSQPKK
ncbi:hypothetical protein [Selenomonas sp.]|uniref:hypothetical protein n=1 Tax=Selenomonas sp. TaxID=2053611 RepID=UPI001CADE4CD|nr:hypothetical protein [Selenomonas sp.]MBF1693432.1 hypothetical protein [Selenomonas sp.]